MKKTILAVLLATTPLAVSAQQVCQAPPAAAAAGYTTQTFGPEMVLGMNWISRTSGNVQNSDGSITINGSSNWNYNDQIDTDKIRFGGGAYIQATLAIKNPMQGWDTSKGWASYWLKSDDDNKNIEIDIFEYMRRGPTFDSGMIPWNAGGLEGGNGAGGEVTNMPVGFDPSKPHRYGWLWVPGNPRSPGYAKVYVDDKLVKEVASWNAGSPLSQLDKNKVKIILGSPTTNPMTVYGVEVWQGSGADNANVTSAYRKDGGNGCSVTYSFVPPPVTGDPVGSSSTTSTGTTGGTIVATQETLPSSPTECIKTSTGTATSTRQVAQATTVPSPSTAAAIMDSARQAAGRTGLTAQEQDLLQQQQSLEQQQNAALQSVRDAAAQQKR